GEWVGVGTGVLWGIASRPEGAVPGKPRLPWAAGRLRWPGLPSAAASNGEHRRSRAASGNAAARVAADGSAIVWAARDTVTRAVVSAVAARVTTPRALT